MLKFNVKNISKSQMPISFDLADKTGVTLYHGESKVILDKDISGTVKNLSKKGMLLITEIDNKIKETPKKKSGNKKEEKIDG